MNRGVDVRIHGLVHIYRAEGHDVAALSGVNLDLAPSATLALLGPSGAGKSTLLTLIAGLTSPTAGSITVDGERLDQFDNKELDRRRGRAIGLVLQGGANNLLGELTLKENIEFAQDATIEGVPSVAELMDWVGLSDEAGDRLPQAATAAQTQLAALCVGAACAPGLLLADEPTAMLNRQETQNVVSALLRINQELGSTVLVVTHDSVLASAMQRTVTIRDGRVGGQAHAGVDIAIVAPDGSLPLPDALLDEWPPGTAVQVDSEHADGVKRLVVREWKGGDEDD